MRHADGLEQGIGTTVVIDRPEKAIPIWWCLLSSERTTRFAKRLTAAIRIRFHAGGPMLQMKPSSRLRDSVVWVGNLHGRVPPALTAPQEAFSEVRDGKNFS